MTNNPNIQRGIEYLTRKGVLDKLTDVDVNTLSMTDPADCILGQIAGDFMDVIIEEVGFPDGADGTLSDYLLSEDAMRWAGEHGFDVPIESRVTSSSYGALTGPSVEYTKLTRQWRDVIIGLREQHGR